MMEIFSQVEWGQTVYIGGTILLGAVLSVALPKVWTFVWGSIVAVAVSPLSAGRWFFGLFRDRELERSQRARRDARLDKQWGPSSGARQAKTRALWELCEQRKREGSEPVELTVDPQELNRSEERMQKSMLNAAYALGVPFELAEEGLKKVVRSIAQAGVPRCPNPPPPPPPQKADGAMERLHRPIANAAYATTNTAYPHGVSTEQATEAMQAFGRAGVPRCPPLPTSPPPADGSRLTAEDVQSMWARLAEGSPVVLPEGMDFKPLPTTEQPEFYVIEHPGHLSELEAANIRRSWEGMHSGDKAPRLMVLEEGMTIKAVAGKEV